MARYFYTHTCAAGSTRLNNGTVKHRKNVTKVHDEALADELAKDARFAEITEDAYNGLLWRGELFRADLHLKPKPTPIPDDPELRKAKAINIEPKAEKKIKNKVKAE